MRRLRLRQAAKCGWLAGKLGSANGNTTTTINKQTTPTNIRHEVNQSASAQRMPRGRKARRWRSEGGAYTTATALMSAYDECENMHARWKGLARRSKNKNNENKNKNENKTEVWK